MDLFWHWGRETLVPNLYPGVLYNNKSDKYTGFISDRNNYLVGISRLRQARVHKGEIHIEKADTRVNNCKFAKDSSIRKFNNAWENHWKPLFALISVRILLKQLDYSLSISMRR